MARLTLTDEEVRAEVEEFDWFLSFGMDVERVCKRLNVDARTMIRRYERLNRPIPAGLAEWDKRRYRKSGSKEKAA